MSERTLLACEDCLPPAEAFAVVANDTRLAILDALWRAPETPVSFSDLRRATGIADSAQFNYHLGKLTGQFVRKVEDGYEFRHAGEKVVRAILEGSFTEDPRIESFAVEGTCVACGGDLHARYADERLTVECPDCGTRHGHAPFPPGGLNDRTREEVVAAFDQRVRHLHCLAADGVCPECGGRMGTSFERDDDRLAGVVHECRQCHHAIPSTVGLRLLDHSAVVAFHHDHGVELCATPFWYHAWCVRHDAVTVRSADPWELEVAIQLDDEELRVTLDGDLAVTDTERKGTVGSGRPTGVSGSPAGMSGEG